MTIIYSDVFVRAIEALSVQEKKTVKKKLILFLENPRHPSLRTKKMAGREDVFESSITMDIRMTWQYTDDGVLLRIIGHHDPTLYNP